MRKPARLIAALAVLFIASRLASSFVTFKNEDTVVELFSTAMDRFLDLDGLPDAGGHPYVRGKLAMVDAEARTLDRWTHFKLPKELRAMDPGEAGTVGLVQWQWQRIGAYIDRETNRETGEAFASLAQLTLVDLAERTVIGRRTFVGDMPASGQAREGDFRSERPMFAIVEYLTRLPRR